MYLQVLLQKLGLIKNAMKGNVTMRLYTDDWPNFSALVCEQISPRITEVNNIANYFVRTCSYVHNINSSAM